MRMLRWMCRVTKYDRLRNEKIRPTTKVVKISQQIEEKKLQWYGHVTRRGENYIGKRVLNMKVEEKETKEEMERVFGRRPDRQRAGRK
jgi:hypothetical protein